MNLNTLEDKVEYILDNVPDTRDNNELLVAYIRKCILRTKFNVKLSDFNAEQVPYLCIKYKLPTVESITRARRKVVERRVDLKPSKVVQAFRKEQEETYREYARG